MLLSETASRREYIISTNITLVRDLTDNKKYGTLFKTNIERIRNRKRE